MWRRVDQVQREFERLLHHVGYYSIQQRTDTVQTWICIDLNQPRFEIAVNHKIQPKDLKIIHLVLRCHFGINTSRSILPYLLHPRQYFFSKIVLLISVRVEVVLELRVRYFIGRLVLAIVWEVLLDGVVGQMDLWFKVVDVEVIGGGTDVAFFVPVGSCYSIEIGYQHVVSYIEFSVVIEKRSIYVHLNYISPLSFLLLLLLFIFATLITLIHDTVKFIDLINDSNPSALVRIFSRFDDPYISSFEFALLTLFLFFYELCSFFVVLCESFVFFIFEAVFDMECQRDVVEEIFAYFSVVFLQVVEQSFFVAQMEVILEMVVDQWFGSIVIMMGLLAILLQR